MDRTEQHIQRNGIVGRSERRKTAYQMRCAGYTYKRIAEELGITDGNAWQLVNRELQKTKQELSERGEELRQIEVARLDDATELCMQRIEMARETPDDAHAAQLGMVAVNTLCKVSERRAKLLGLDKQKDEGQLPAVQQMTVQEKVQALLADPELGSALEQEVLRRRGFVVDTEGEQT